MKTFAHRNRPAPPPEPDIKMSSNRMLPRKYDRLAAEQKYILADHAPLAIFEPIHEMNLLPRYVR
jgi:hypothetical protein